jgi:8-oxo-dGTP pyrophosphatase MutT (NUDIX family)
MAAVERVAARVILLDREGRTLLFRGGDPGRPEDGEWWFTPGGGVEPGETLEEAARREVHEETGFVLTGDLGPVVLQRRFTMWFQGVELDQSEHFFVALVERRELDDSGWTDVERRTVFAHRWWTARELAATDERVYPENLLELLPGPNGVAGP